MGYTKYAVFHSLKKKEIVRIYLSEFICHLSTNKCKCILCDIYKCDKQSYATADDRSSDWCKVELMIKLIFFNVSKKRKKKVIRSLQNDCLYTDQ